MIKISKQNNSLIVEGIDNVFYPNNGNNSYPLNSLIVVIDDSNMATFRSVATNDVLFSGLIEDIIINGEAVTKDNIITKFDAVSNSTSTGGGGGSVDAYTKTESDAKYATKDELTAVETVANDADTKVDALTTRVEGVETSMNDKQDLLVSGTNIKTINNQSILGEGNIEISDYYTKTEADEIFATTTQVNHQAADISALQTDMRGKQATLVSGENIKTINGESVLGEGNIEVAKKTDIPNTDNFATKNELTAVETVANNAATKADAVTSRVESVETTLNNKQDTLVSGTNIKTVNSQSILGEGNIEVSGGITEEQAQEIAKIPTIETELAQKANVSDVPTVQTKQTGGTDKNYIYSDYKSKNKLVFSNFLFRAYSTSFTMEAHPWGENENYVENYKVPLATTKASGVMSAADKIKLDSVPETIPSQSEIDGIAADVSALQTAMDGKQPTLVSGTNIKTINGNSILGEGNLVIEGGGIDLSNYYNKTEVDTKLDTKQNTLVSGTNIKTINSQSILGEGNLEVSGGIKIYEASEMPKNLKDALIIVVNEAYYTLDKTYTIDKSTDVEEFLSNLKTGDYLQLTEDILIQYYGITSGIYKFAIKTGKEITDYNVYGRLISVRIISNEFYISNNNSGPVLQKNDLKTINGEKIVGSGNLEVTIPDATTANSGAMSAADKTKLDSISNEWTGTQSEFDALTTKDDNIIYYVTE